MWGPGHVEAVCVICGPIRLEARQVTGWACARIDEKHVARVHPDRDTTRRVGP